MEKYFGIHHRYENKITRVRRFLFILHTTATADLLTIFRFPKYLKIGIEIFKYLNNLMFKYSDIWNIWILYSHEIHAYSKFGQTYYRIWFWQCIVEQKEDFGESFLNWLMIYVTFSLNVCWMLMFVYRWRRGDNFPFLLGLFWLLYQRFHSLNFYR